MSEEAANNETRTRERLEDVRKPMAAMHCEVTAHPTRLHNPLYTYLPTSPPTKSILTDPVIFSTTDDDLTFLTHDHLEHSHSIVALGI